MPNYFLDSSALVKRYRREEGTVRVGELLETAERVIVARLTELEVSAAIVRRSQATNQPQQLLTLILAAIDHDLAQSFEIVELELPVFRRAVQLTRQHKLRAADAIQLACALFAAEELPQRDLTMLSCDQELNAAALAEGLTVIDPTQL